MTLKNEWPVFKSLVQYRLFSMKKIAFDKFVNWAIWTAGTLVVMGYLMQSFGLREDFGVFQLAGIFGAVAIFENYEILCIDFLVDIESDNIFGYHTTLACSLPTMLLAYVVAQAIVSIVICIFVIPLGKLLLWNTFVLTHVSWFALAIVIVVASTMCAILALWLNTFIRSMEKIGNLWTRIIWPMWILGGFQFSFTSTYAVWPLFAYAMLISPLTYATEGARKALLGGDYLDSWLCVGVMIVFSVVLFFDCVRRYRRWLDLV